MQSEVICELGLRDLEITYDCDRADFPVISGLSKARARNGELPPSRSRCTRFVDRVVRTKGKARFGLRDPHAIMITARVTLVHGSHFSRRAVKSYTGASDYDINRSVSCHGLIADNGIAAE